jgi:sigma-E factor negative regulatory protein RseB
MVICKAGALGAWVRWLAAVAIVSSMGLAPAGTEAQAASVDFGAWLDRVHHAAQAREYEGTLVYQRGGVIQSSRIVHFTDGGNEYEQIESLDGKPRRMLRQNDNTYTFIPDRGLCLVAKRLNRDSFPALLSVPGEQALTVYTAHATGVDRVAGHDVDVVELQPRDAYRYAYRLWAEKRSGLLLRSQTLAPDGRVLEQMAFSEIRFGAPADRSLIAKGMRDLSAWRVVRSPSEPADLAAQGWRIQPELPGFREISALRRPMQARDPATAPVRVDQVVFSDGLSAVSVFIEPVGGERTAGLSTAGATSIFVQRQGDFWITALGEVPPATLERFAASLEFKTAK